MASLSGRYPRAAQPISWLAVARRYRRPATWAHSVVGNRSRAGWFARNARAGPSTATGARVRVDGAAAARAETLKGGAAWQVDQLKYHIWPFLQVHLLAYARRVPFSPTCIDRDARLALGGAFLSAVAGRFGFWAGVPWGEAFARFIDYTAEVNAFMPSATIPWLAWAATVAEVTLGAALILGVRVREAALASAALLAIFGTAMALSFGPKSPLDCSVFSASAGALLLASRQPRPPGAPR